VLAIEIFLRLGFVTTLMAVLEISKKAYRVILSPKISDHWKEAIIPRYSIALMQSCLRMLIILMLMASAFLLADLLYPGTLRHALSLPGLFESLLFAFIYIRVKRSFGS
jgi:hypothetical protein